MIYHGNLIGDTNMLDLDQTVFSRSDFIIEETINSLILHQKLTIRIDLNEEEKDNIKEIILNQYKLMNQ